MSEFKGTKIRLSLKGGMIAVALLAIAIVGAEYGWREIFRSHIRDEAAKRGISEDDLARWDFPLPYFFEAIRASGKRSPADVHNMIFGYNDRTVDGGVAPATTLRESYRFDSGLISSDTWLNVIYARGPDGEFSVEWMGTSKTGAMPLSASFYPYYFTRPFDLVK